MLSSRAVDAPMAGADEGIALPKRIRSDPRPTLIDTAVGKVAVTSEGPEAALAVLCIHGLPGSSRDFRYLAPQLSETFRVIRVEAPGFGASPLPTRGVSAICSMDGWCEVLSAVADALGVERYALLGHSLGGLVAILAASSCDGGAAPAGLVLVASAGARPHRGYFLPRWGFEVLARATAQPFVRRPLARLGRQLYRKLGFQPLARGDWRTLNAHLLMLSSISFERIAEGARAVRCPTLICHSADDPVVHLSIARESARLIPRSDTLIFEDGGHRPQKHHAEAIAAAMTQMF